MTATTHVRHRLMAATIAGFVALASLPGHTAAAHSVYAIKPLRAGSNILQVTLSLPPTDEARHDGARYDGSPRRLLTRGASWGLKEQVQSPRCGRVLLQRNRQGAWLVPASCTEVSWLVEPKGVADGMTDVSEQATIALKDAGWTLLAEATALLRLAGDTTEATLTAAMGGTPVIGATPLGASVWRLPAPNKVPEFFVIGAAANRWVTVGGYHVRHVADDPARVAQLRLVELHERALDYLSHVLQPPPEVAPEDRALLVIWIGVAQRHGMVGGAAGRRSFVANYVFDDEREGLGSGADSGRALIVGSGSGSVSVSGSGSGSVAGVGERDGVSDGDRLNAARTLLVVAHEQFHQLADQFRGARPTLPPWLNESLAHYYGLKALAAATPGTEARVLWGRFIDPDRSVDRGLMAWGRLHEAMDPRAYPAFLDQGATFWTTLDEALRDNRPGAAGLDALLPELLRSPIGSDGRLPANFIDHARAIAGARIDRIIERYVGP